MEIPLSSAGNGRLPSDREVGLSGQANELLVRRAAPGRGLGRAKSLQNRSTGGLPCKTGRQVGYQKPRPCAESGSITVAGAGGGVFPAICAPFAAHG